MKAARPPSISPRHFKTRAAMERRVWVMRIIEAHEPILSTDIRKALLGVLKELQVLGTLVHLKQEQLATVRIEKDREAYWRLTQAGRDYLRAQRLWQPPLAVPTAHEAWVALRAAGFKPQREVPS